MDYFIFGECMSCFIDFIDINLWEKYTLTNLVSEKAVDQSGKGERLHQPGPFPGRWHFRRHDGPPWFCGDDPAA